jgi:ectoine hydrolase
MVIPAAEFAERRRRAAREATQRGLDGLLVWGRGGSLDAFSDVHYFSNHYSPMVWVPPLPGVLSGCEHSALLIEPDGSGTLFVSDFCSVEAQVDRVRRGWDLTAELVSHLVAIGAEGSRLGAIGEEVLPFGVVTGLTEALPALRLLPADEISSQLRLRLSESEVAMLVRAGEVGRSIYAEFLAHVVQGASEGEAVGAAIRLAAQIPGCMHWNFISASGPDADALVRFSIPPWKPDRTYSAGDVVHADCFGYVDGYCYDLARTVVIPGDTASRAVAVAGATAEAVREVAGALRPGVTSRELCETAQRALATRGLSSAGGSFGHGIGAGFFRPYLVPAGPDLDRAIEPPFGMSIELFATDGEGGFAYHEDNYVVLERETICLTGGAPLTEP